MATIEVTSSTAVRGPLDLRAVRSWRSTNTQSAVGIFGLAMTLFLVMIVVNMAASAVVTRSMRRSQGK